MASAPALSSSSEYAKVEVKTDQPTVDPSCIDKVYRTDLMAEHIKANDYKVPCLQFPDDLVQDSTHVATSLQQKIGRPVYVLADTSYSPCCIDEIAAQHVSGDVVFHFGDACLNPTKALPAVFIRRDIEHNFSVLEEQLAKTKDTVVLYPEVDYVDLALELSSRLGNRFVVAIPSSSSTFIPPLNKTTAIQKAEFPSRVLTQPIEDLSVCELVYITDSPSESLLLHWSTAFKVLEVIAPSGAQLNVTPALRRRYRHVQSVKASGTIGILINTLSLRDTQELLTRIKKAVTRAEKKYYMFVVGKPNVAKLGNFEAIDIWVVLGCPQGGTLMDDTEYTKPIVTPYELELAFNDDWTGKWLLDFQQVLQSEGGEDESAPTTSANKCEAEPLFDLVTGKFVFNNTPLRQVSHLDLDSGELQKSSNELTVRNTVSTAAQKLQRKSWQGLGSDHADMVGDHAELKKGRSGIARDYSQVS